MRIELIIFAVSAVLMVVAVSAFLVFSLPEMAKQNEKIDAVSEKLESCDCFAAKRLLYDIPEPLTPLDEVNE